MKKVGRRHREYERRTYKYTCYRLHNFIHLFYIVGLALIGSFYTNYSIVSQAAHETSNGWDS